MDLICYAHKRCKTAAPMLNLMQSSLPHIPLTVCRTLVKLRQELMRPLVDVLAVVVFITEPEELVGIMELKESLLDTRLLLLPEDEAWVAPVRGLRPRYVGTVEEGAIISVLGKMAARATGEAHHDEGPEARHG